MCQQSIAPWFSREVSPQYKCKNGKVTAMYKCVGDSEAAAAWAAKCVEQKKTVSLTYSVPFSIPRTPSAPGCQNGKAREYLHPQSWSRREAAGRYDQRGASIGTGQSWQGQQCCQRNGCSGECPDEAARLLWINRQSQLMSDTCVKLRATLLEILRIYHETFLHHNLWNVFENISNVSWKCCEIFKNNSQNKTKHIMVKSMVIFCHMLWNITRNKT